MSQRRARLDPAVWVMEGGGSHGGRSPRAPRSTPVNGTAAQAGESEGSAVEFKTAVHHDGDHVLIEWQADWITTRRRCFYMWFSGLFTESSRTSWSTSPQ